MAKRSPKPIDVMVGQNIRIARMQAGISQGKLGEACGITFQQIQKYEKGTNRVGASRMAQLAAALRVTIPELFEGTQSATAHIAPAPGHETARAMLAKPHSLRLLEAFGKITNQETALAILHMVESLPATPRPVATRKRKPA